MSTVHQSTDSSVSQTLLSEMGELKRAVRAMVQDTGRSQIKSGSGELYAAYEQLVRGEVADELAQQIVADIRSSLSSDELSKPEVIQDKLIRVVESMLPVAGAVELSKTKSPTVIALVGPTGVGKTTTIAKLAANFALRDNRRVGLITIDTYRIAAVQQLRTYAEIIGVPLEVVTSPSELHNAVRRMSDLDVVLIDTAGRGQRDAGKISELSSFFTMVAPDEIHLVLSTTSGQAVLKQAMDRFRPLAYDKVIFTKLDEAVGFGVMLACLQHTKARLSYVTMGQDVPDDIRAGDSTSIARLISGGRTTSSQAPGGRSAVAVTNTLETADVAVGHAHRM